MEQHPNAKLTPKGRETFASRAPGAFVQSMRACGSLC